MKQLRTATVLLGVGLNLGCGGSYHTSKLNGESSKMDPTIGYGYNHVSNKQVPTCLSYDRKNITRSKTGYAQVGYYQNLSASSLQEKTNGNGTLSVDAGSAVSMSGSVKFLNERSSDNLSSTYTVLSKVGGFMEQLREPTVPDTKTEDTSFTNSNFLSFSDKGLDSYATHNAQIQLDTCGDSYVNVVEYGAYFSATLKIDYKNRGHKEMVEGSLSFDIAQGLLKVKGEGGKLSEGWEKDIKVTLFIDSLAGNSAILPHALTPGITQCDGSVDGFKKCIEQVNAIIEFAKHSLPAQLLGKIDMKACENANDGEQAPNASSDAAASKASGTVKNYCFEAADVDFDRLKPLSFGTASYRSIGQFTDTEDGQKALIDLPSKPLSPEALRLMEQHRQWMSDGFYEVAADASRVKLVEGWLKQRNANLDEIKSLQTRVSKQLKAFVDAIPACNTWQEDKNGSFNPNVCTAAYESLLAKISEGGALYYDREKLAMNPPTFAEWCDLYYQAMNGDQAKRDWILSPGGQKTVLAVINAVTALKNDPTLKDEKNSAQICTKVQSDLNSTEALTLNDPGNLEPLATIKTLKDLVLISAQNSVYDVSPLQHVRRLKNLSISGFNLTDDAGFQRLANLRFLEKIDVSNNRLRNLDFLKGMPYLKNIKAQKNELEDISGLASETCRLESMDLEGEFNLINTIKPIVDSCKQLKTLRFQTKNIALTKPDELAFCENEGVTCLN